MTPLGPHPEPLSRAERGPSCAAPACHPVTQGSVTTRFFDQRIGSTAFSRLAALSATLIFPALAVAQAYPSRPIRLVIAVAPGGGTDIISRLLATRLTERLGQTVVVDNRGGGNFIIGTSIVAKAAPDGYTLVTATNASHAINPGLFSDLPYDPLRDFTPDRISSSAWRVSAPPRWAARRNKSWR
jgi:hypothetical protein